MKTKTFTKTAGGTTVKVNVNEEFVIELHENPTTGYGWQITANEGVLIVSSNFTLNTAIAVGSGGLHHFVLKATKPGTFRLGIKLKQPWEDESVFVDRFEIGIEAE